MCTWSVYLTGNMIFSNFSLVIYMFRIGFNIKIKIGIDISNWYFCYFLVPIWYFLFCDTFLYFFFVFLGPLGGIFLKICVKLIKLQNWRKVYPVLRHFLNHNLVLICFVRVAVKECVETGLCIELLFCSVLYICRTKSNMYREHSII